MDKPENGKFAIDTQISGEVSLVLCYDLAVRKSYLYFF